MTEPFAAVLATGGRSNSLGRAADVLAAVRADATRTDELVGCVADDDAWVRMRAVDTLEKLVREDPARGTPYVGWMLDDLARSEQPSLRWHLAQMLTVVDLDAEQRRTALAWLQERVAEVDTDWIVAAETMKALVAFHERGLVAADVVAPLLEGQRAHRSASVRRQAGALLDRVRATGPG